jgi:hypothetical protein
MAAGAGLDSAKSAMSPARITPHRLLIARNAHAQADQYALHEFLHRHVRPGNAS